MKKLLLIIPAYNEEQSILGLISEIREHCTNVDYLVVNDGSTDRTEQILIENGINHICLPANLGIGGGIQAGYRYALRHGYDCAIQVDGDGQHDCRYVQALVQPILDGTADFTIGSRYVQKEGFQSSLLRRLGIRWLSWVIFLVSGVRIKDVTSGFRAVGRPLIELFSWEYADDYPEPEAIITAIRHGARVKEIPVIMRQRTGGESSISGFKSVYYMIKVTLAILLNDLLVRKGGLL